MASSENVPLVLFDGVCNVCNGTVTFLIDRDPNGVMRFASLQSPAGRAAIEAHGCAATKEDPDSIVVVEGDRIYERSSAALRIARHMPWPYRALYALVVVPRPLRDFVYVWFARNRYRWFGKSETCRIPTPELRARFVE